MACAAFFVSAPRGDNARNEHEPQNKQTVLLCCGAEHAGSSCHLKLHVAAVISAKKNLFVVDANWTKMACRLLTKALHSRGHPGMKIARSIGSEATRSSATTAPRRPWRFEMSKMPASSRNTVSVKCTDGENIQHSRIKFILWSNWFVFERTNDPLDTAKFFLSLPQFLRPCQYALLWA